MRGIGLVIFLGLLNGCSSIPDVEYRYYLAKMSITANVTQTVDCNAYKTALIISNVPSVAASYASDLTKGPYRIRLNDINGAFGTFADTDMSMSFYDDGRLKSINQSTTGQGEEIIKSAVTLAGAFVGGGGPGTAAEDMKSMCTKIGTLGDNKPVSVTYTKVISYAPAGADQTLDLPVAAASLSVHAKLAAILGGNLPPLGLIIDKPKPVESGAGYSAPSSSDGDIVGLQLPKMLWVNVEVTSKGATFANTLLTAPSGETYTLPIPKAALFGKQSLQLTLSEAGAITTIDYGKLTGVSGALNAANSIATGAEPPSAATQAAALKAQGDLIAQHQRLVRCQANPATCQ
jgi:hypothetical protein